ncbi:MAG: MBL fold metallo-hydrolase [Promethearchaeota archaeon]
MVAEENSEILIGNTIIPIKLGFVSCYLIKTSEGFILIDTGFPRKRKDLEKALNEAGCESGSLRLLILTHQDFDHTGNAVFIREKYNCPIAMHIEDVEAVERGDMLWKRKGRNIFTRVILKIILIAYRTGKFEKFTPDVKLAHGDDLSSYGFNASVLHLPGHSKGSIGILTADGALFCGDLFMNLKKPGRSSLVDRKEDLNASIEKLKGYEINLVYPGHGSVFVLADFFAPPND